VYFDRTIERLTEEELSHALEEALAGDRHEALVVLINEIERRGGVVQV
jgi:hypothetical protein